MKHRHRVPAGKGGRGNRGEGRVRGSGAIRKESLVMSPVAAVAFSRNRALSLCDFSVQSRHSFRREALPNLSGCLVVADQQIPTNALPN
jgi:hypothetical protein